MDIAVRVEGLHHHKQDTQETMKLRVLAFSLAFFAVLASMEALPAPAPGFNPGKLHTENKGEPPLTP